MKKYNINNNKIPITTRTTTKKQTTITEYHGIIEIAIPKTETNTLRTIIKNNKNTITELYQQTTQKPIPRTTEQYTKICEKYLNQYQQKLKVTVNQLKQKDMKITHLGTAGGRLNNIILNKKLQYMNEDIIALTIYHEICHLWTWQNLHTMKHDKDFYNKLHEEYPPEKIEQIQYTNKM